MFWVVTIIVSVCSLIFGIYLGQKVFISPIDIEDRKEQY